MKCLVCDGKAPTDCQLCKRCLAEVKTMKYETPKPATFHEAVEILRQRRESGQ